MPKPLSQQIHEAQATLESLKSLRHEIQEAAKLLVDTLKAGNKVLACGNGGSAAEAGHFATEITGRYKSNRPSLPAINLSADASLITCCGNDFGFKNIFARQVEGLGQKGDLLVVFTSSGNSDNLTEALKTAKQKQLRTIVMSGRGGGIAAKLGDIALTIPGESGRSAQEAHLFLIHTLCEHVEEAFPAVE